jgi:hypothetical protein
LAYAPGRVALADEFPAGLASCGYALANETEECSRQTANFLVRSFVGGPAAADVAAHCERLRDHLGCKVFDFDASARWQRKCVVVLHASRAAYARAVGAGGSQTVGSSNVSFSAGRITQRRIDLLAADADKGLAALPHELVHVLFADAFPNTPPPKWAEEGFALLLDSPDKQARHRRDLATAFASRTTLPLQRLLADPNYPSPAHRAAFYAQSLSLVEYFTADQSPKEFIRFVKLSLDRGHDAALQTIYGLDTHTLERAWHERTSSGT